MKSKPIILSTDRKEYLQSDLNGLPIAFYISDFSDHQYDYIDWHWHDELQYCLVVKGTMQFNVGTQKYELTEGNGIFINSKQVHSSRPIHSNDARYYCFEFSPSILLSQNESVIYQSYVLPIISDSTYCAGLLSNKDQINLNVLTAIRNVKSLLDTRPSAFELDLLMEIMKIWKYTFLHPNCKKNIPPIVSRENERLRNIFQVIHDHYSNDLSLEMIAKEVHLSRSECSRFFHKCTGQGLFQYLNQYRIQKSLNLLSSTNMSIAEIAYSVGFTNQSYYTACFKKEIKMTPRQYRASFLSEKKCPN